MNLNKLQKYNPLALLASYESSLKSLFKIKHTKHFEYACVSLILAFIVLTIMSFYYVLSDGRTATSGPLMLMMILGCASTIFLVLALHLKSVIFALSAVTIVLASALTLVTLMLGLSGSLILSASICGFAIFMASKRLNKEMNFIIQPA